MKIEPFCAWGDGPDVGINMSRTPEEAARWASPDLHWFVDLTAAEARALAAKLISCAEAAEFMDRMCAEHDDQVPE